VGCQVRRRLPLRAGGPRDHVRPARLTLGLAAARAGRASGGSRRNNPPSGR
jgi:hypothetical protein